jgi:hypothetical protein
MGISSVDGAALYAGAAPGWRRSGADGNYSVMAYYCWTCRNELYFDVKVGVKVGRRDSCMHCGADLHCCKNCRLYDPNIHNQCREQVAEYIRDREGGNFCPHFDFKDQGAAPGVDDAAAKAKSKLDDLFKNLK